MFREEWEMIKIREIGIETKDLQRVEWLLRSSAIPYYVEPPSDNNYESLEDLECQCEGK